MLRISPLPPETVIINMWSSRCNNCQRDCDPTEKKHEKELGYGSKPGDKGCGIEWKYVTSEYSHALNASAEMRPDLEPIKWGIDLFDKSPV